MENSSIAARLKSIIHFLGLSDSQFADKCDISRATLSLLLSGKNKKISDVLLSQIHNTFPNVSIIWLLFNEGAMINEVKESTKRIFSDIDFKNEQIRPDLPENDTQAQEYSKLMPLNHIENTIKQSVLKAFEAVLEDEAFYLNKNFKDNKRKVRQVTVYYDDSTFETFLPGS